VWACSSYPTVGTNSTPEPLLCHPELWHPHSPWAHHASSLLWGFSFVPNDCLVFIAVLLSSSRLSFLSFTRIRSTHSAFLSFFPTLQHLIPWPSKLCHYTDLNVRKFFFQMTGLSRIQVQTLQSVWRYMCTVTKKNWKATVPLGRLKV